MKIKKLALAASCMVLLCGCTKSNIVNPDSPVEPDTENHWDIVLEEEQLQKDVEELYLDEKDYPVASAIAIDLNLDEGYVGVDVVVKDGTSPKEAAEYAMTVIKGVNDEAAVQDFTYGKSGEDTYGGLYQDNEIRVKIYEESVYAAKGTPIYEAVIPKDEYQLIVIE